METAEQDFLGEISAKVKEYHKVAQSVLNHRGKYATASVYGDGEHLGIGTSALRG